MKTLNLAFLVAVLIAVILSAVSWTEKKDYIVPLPIATIEGTPESQYSAANLEPATHFSFTVNDNGTLSWYEDNE